MDDVQAQMSGDEEGTCAIVVVVVVVGPEVCLRCRKVVIIERNCAYPSTKGDGRKDHIQRMTISVTSCFVLAAPTSNGFARRAAVKK